MKLIRKNRHFIDTKKIRIKKSWQNSVRRVKQMEKNKYKLKLLTRGELVFFKKNKDRNIS